jgi:pyridoxine 5-phosphate synthase
MGWIGMGLTRLSVNLNKVALLRNSRGADLPSLDRAAETVLAAGAGGITLHPRPDLRHARPDDIAAQRARCTAPLELNLEGNPFAPANPRYPGFLALLGEHRPDQATLVPDADAQLTSDHGFDLAADEQRLRPIVAQLRALGMRVSLFVDMDVPEVQRAADIGADGIEIYTGPYAHAFASGDPGAALDACARTATAARACGLLVNAGHDLDLQNLGPLLRHCGPIAEVSIGHALIGEALYRGLDATVRAYLAVIAAAHGR